MDDLNYPYILDNSSSTNILNFNNREKDNKSKIRRIRDKSTDVYYIIN